MFWFQCSRISISGSTRNGRVHFPRTEIDKLVSPFVCKHNHSTKLALVRISTTFMNEISFSALIPNLYGWRMFSTHTHTNLSFSTSSHSQGCCAAIHLRAGKWVRFSTRKELTALSPEGNSPTGNGCRCCWLLRKSYQINRASAAARNKSATSHANRWWRHGALIMWLWLMVYVCKNSRFLHHLCNILLSKLKRFSGENALKIYLKYE